MSSVKDVIKAAARAGGYAAELIGNTFYIVKPDDVGSRHKSSHYHRQDLQYTLL